MENNLVIEANNLTKTYAMGEVEVRALRDVSIQIRQGESIAIMGASGSGKSTLMNILGCLDQPTTGEYLLKGTNVAELDDKARWQPSISREKPSAFSTSPVQDTAYCMFT